MENVGARAVKDNRTVVPISVVVLAKNETDRIGEAIASAAWADEVVVADTGSTDGTPELVRAAGARAVEIPWEGFVRSRNRALQCARNDWVLFLDADERTTAAYRDAVQSLLEREGDRLAGVRMPRLSTFLGRAVRHGTWYPDVNLRLGRRSRGFRAEGGRVHETFAVDGPVGRVETPLLHVPYRDISDALRKSTVYARLAAEDRFERGVRANAPALVIRPIWEFFRCYLLKRGFLDGRVGFAVAFLHAWSYFLRAAFLVERARQEPSVEETP